MEPRAYVAKKRRASGGGEETPVTELVYQPASNTDYAHITAAGHSTQAQADIGARGAEMDQALTIRRPHAGLPNVPSTVDVHHGSFFDDYTLGDVLGRGTFSIVRRCLHRQTGEVRAVKIIDTKKFRLSQSFRVTTVLDEVRILRGLDHGGIIRIYDVYDMTGGTAVSASTAAGKTAAAASSNALPSDSILIVTELASGGELFDSIIKAGNFTEAQARYVLWQVLDALRYLHDRGVVHRDLKPENLLVSDTLYVPAMDPIVRPGRPYPRTQAEATALTQADPARAAYTPMLRVKLADFGVARYVGNAAYNAGATTFVGSPQYVAPEVLFAREYHGQAGRGEDAGQGIGATYGRAVDIYSLGVIAYVMLAGYLPFDDGAPVPNDQDCQARMSAVLQRKREAAARAGATPQQVAAIQHLTWEDKVKHGLFFMSPPVWTHVSEAGKDLIRHMMDADSTRRFTVHAVMAHPWFAPLKEAMEQGQGYGMGRQGPGRTPMDGSYAQRLLSAPAAGLPVPMPMPMPIPLAIMDQGGGARGQAGEGGYPMQGISMSASGTGSSMGDSSERGFSLPPGAFSLPPSSGMGHAGAGGVVGDLGFGSGFGLGMGGLGGMDATQIAAANRARQSDVYRAVSQSIDFTALLSMQREVAATFYAAYAAVRTIPQAALIVRGHAVQARDLHQQVRKTVMRCRNLSESILGIMADLTECVEEGNGAGANIIFEQMVKWVIELKNESGKIQSSYRDLIARVQDSLEQARALNLEGVLGGAAGGPGGHRHNFMQWIPRVARTDALVLRSAEDAEVLRRLHGPKSSPTSDSSPAMEPHVDPRAVQAQRGVGPGVGAEESKGGDLSQDELMELFLSTPSVVADAPRFDRYMGQLGVDVSGRVPPQVVGGSRAAPPPFPTRTASHASQLPNMMASMTVTTPLAGPSAGTTASPQAAYPAGSSGRAGGGRGSAATGTGTGSYDSLGGLGGMGPGQFAPSPNRSREGSMGELHDANPWIAAGAASSAGRTTPMSPQGAGGVRAGHGQHPSADIRTPDRRPAGGEVGSPPLFPQPSESGSSTAESPAMSMHGHGAHGHRHGHLSGVGVGVGEGVGTSTALDTLPDACLWCALDGLRAVDRVLSAAVTFWSGMELVLDMLVRRKEHSQALLDPSASARMREKAMRSVADYILFWRAFGVLCLSYSETSTATERDLYKWLQVAEDEFPGARPSGGAAGGMPLLQDVGSHGAEVQDGRRPAGQLATGQQLAPVMSL